jgi:hypothetical protein
MYVNEVWVLRKGTWKYYWQGPLLGVTRLGNQQNPGIIENTFQEVAVKLETVSRTD